MDEVGLKKIFKYRLNCGYFFMVATTLVDLLLIELMSHLSHVQQMYSQPKHQTHELILCIQIVDTLVVFYA